MLSLINQKYFKLAVGKLKKDKADEIVACCPHCGDQKNRLHLYHTEIGDLVHCFNDGCELSDSHHSVRNFLNIVNSPYLPNYKRATLNDQVKDLKDAQNMQSLLDKVNKETKGAKKILTKEIPLGTLFSRAQDSEECMAYLSTRNIYVQEDWFFSKDKFFTYNNKKVFLENYLLIPIYDENYKYKGFYSRSIKEKSFSMFLLDGAERIWRSCPDRSPDIICEGIFDSLSTGYTNSAAMLGADLSVDYRNTLPIGKAGPVFAFDNDKTGINKALKYTDLGYKIFVWPEIEYKDFNEMLVSGSSREEIKKIIEDNTYLGILAKAKLKMKGI